MTLTKALDKIKPYVISIAIALGVGILSAFFTRGNMDIYDVIVKPPLAPPGILFPIAWTILYALMGVSSAMVYINREKTPLHAKDALYTYAISLVVNFAWSILFFNLGAFLVSFIWLLFLLALIIATIIRYLKVDKLSAYLQIPYAVWVVFAGYLNLAIFILNP